MTSETETKLVRRKMLDTGELDAALERALAHDGPSMVEVVADPELV